MVERVRCSECGEELNVQGFGGHNHAAHDMAAEAEPIDPVGEGGEDDPDPDPEPEPDAGADPDPDPEPEPEPEAGADPDPDPEPEAGADPDPDPEPDPSRHAGEVDAGDDGGGEDKPHECGNCGHPLAYLGGEDRRGGGKACPECGERLLWSRVEA
jgi:DNA-directed RNA polymerase subunit RPC12/RpoP